MYVIIGVIAVLVGAVLWLASRVTTLDEENRALTERLSNCGHDLQRTKDALDTWRSRYRLLEAQNEGDFDGDGVPDRDMEYVRKSLLGESEES